MRQDYLKQFYEMEQHRESVKAFLFDIVDEMALDAVYKGEEVSGFKHARDTIKEAFAQLREEYAKEDKPLKVNASK